MKRLHRIWPSSLKNRLFVAILLFVLVPSTLLQIRNITQLETMMKDNVSQQNAEQLEYLKNSMESLRVGVLGAMLQLERDPEVKDRLQHPEAYDPQELTLQLENRLIAAKQGLMNAVIPVHLTLSDGAGHLYSSPAEEPGSSQPFGVEQLSAKDLERLTHSAEPYYWDVHEWESELQGLLPSPEVFSLYAKLQAVDGETFGYLRVSLDIKTWLNSITNGFQVKQTYYLLDGSGQPIMLGKDDRTTDRIKGMLPAFKSRPERYFTDEADRFLFNGIYMPNMDWYLVDRFPLEALSGNIMSMKHQVLLSFMATVVVFIGVTYAIVASIVRPLRNMQRKMSELADRNLNIRLPEHKYRGETLMLAKAFNQMTGDIRRLIDRLKAEERQKEAIRFQMLMSQMNPHFLLNTLNTIKWNARNFGDKGTSEICLKLGKLLECSLNDEVDLVHLKEEIELVQAYLYIQSFRYDHTFTTEYEIEDDLQYALIPKLSLQPLVENSIYHGLIHMKKGGTIAISVRRIEDRLRVEVRDNGQGLQQPSRLAARKRKGIGISNLRERLALLYKNEASLELLPQEQGMVAVLDIPLLLSSPYDKEGYHEDHSAG
ncbi:sensor histidine kinase [Paenibacillus albidus]|uniref:sensor histidine kinase n=1 Tax=Paenibacillus albidus TaxID=2041023 RepID=UPI001BE6BF26|nr:sensor histidine kinase [Paenibacillus albidus]MBT2290608.1 sensor histidine kinase [Paenibacillus albidus]